MKVLKHVLVLGVALALGAATATPSHAGHEEGVAHFKAKRYKEAASEFEAEVGVHPNWYFPHYMLGLTYSKLKRYDDAVASLEESIVVAEQDKDKIPSHIAIAKAHATRKRYAKAEASYRSALKFKPTGRLEVQANSGLADALLGQKKYKQAAGLYDKIAGSVKSDSLPYKRAVAHYKAGNATKSISVLQPHIKSGADTKVLKLYVQSNMSAAKATSNGSTKSQRWGAALQASELLVAASPNDAEALGYRADAHLGSKNFGAAASDYQKLVGMKPRDSSAYLNLAQAHMGNGNWKAASDGLMQGIRSCKPNDSLHRFHGICQEKIAAQQKTLASKIASLEAAVDAYQKAVKLSASGSNSQSLARAEANLSTARENKQIDADNARIIAQNKEARRENELIEEENKRREAFNRLMEQEFGSGITCGAACQECLKSCGEGDAACRKGCTAKTDK